MHTVMTYYEIFGVLNACVLSKSNLFMLDLSYGIRSIHVWFKNNSSTDDDSLSYHIFRVFIFKFLLYLY